MDLCDTKATAKRREVPTEEAEQWAKQEGLLFVEASAKSGKNVEEAFIQAASDILGKIRRGVFDDDRVRVIPLEKSFQAPASFFLPAWFREFNSSRVLVVPP